MRLRITIIVAVALSMRLQAQPARLPEQKHRFTVIAHRGDHILVPENTLAAFESAIADSADYVEIDLRTTKDSVLVIMHDASVNRMTNGKGNISDLSYAQIQQLSVLHKNDSDQKYTVPRFEEVLTLCKNRIHIYLDFKNASVAQTYHQIKETGMERQLIVYINSLNQYVQWRKLAPEIPVMLSLPDSVKDVPALTSFLNHYPLELLDGDYSQYTPEMVKKTDSESVTTWPDIQGPEENKNWEKALRIGFRGLQTDHPRDLIAWLTNAGLR